MEPRFLIFSKLENLAPNNRSQQNSYGNILLEIQPFSTAKITGWKVIINDAPSLEVAHGRAAGPLLSWAQQLLHFFLLRSCLWVIILVILQFAQMVFITFEVTQYHESFLEFAGTQQCCMFVHQCNISIDNPFWHNLSGQSYFFFEYQLIVFIFFVEVTLMNKLIPQFVDMNWTCVKDSDPRLGKLGCVDVDEKVVAWKIPLVLRAVLKKHKLQSRSCQFLCLHGF